MATGDAPNDYAMFPMTNSVDGYDATSVFYGNIYMQLTTNNTLTKFVGSGTVGVDSVENADLSNGYSYTHNLGCSPYYDGAFYIGGQGHSFYRYNISANTWTKLADIPEIGAESSVTLTSGIYVQSSGLNGYMYFSYMAIGASNYSYLLRYSITMNSWSIITHPSATFFTRTLLSAIWDGTSYGSIILATSLSNDNYNFTFYKYTPSTNTWIQLPNLLSSNTLNINKIYSDGSNLCYNLDSGSGNNTGILYTCYLSTNTWYDMYPQGLNNNTPVIVFGGKAYIAVGNRYTIFNLSTQVMINGATTTNSAPVPTTGKGVVINNQFIRNINDIGVIYDYYF